MYGRKISISLMTSVEYRADLHNDRILAQTRFFVRVIKNINYLIHLNLKPLFIVALGTFTHADWGPSYLRFARPVPLSLQFHEWK